MCNICTWAQATQTKAVKQTPQLSTKLHLFHLVLDSSYTYNRKKVAINQHRCEDKTSFGGGHKLWIINYIHMHTGTYIHEHIDTTYMYTHTLDTNWGWQYPVQVPMAGLVIKQKCIVLPWRCCMQLTPPTFTAPDACKLPMSMLHNYLGRGHISLCPSHFLHLCPKNNCPKQCEHWLLLLTRNWDSPSWSLWSWCPTRFWMLFFVRLEFFFIHGKAGHLELWE